jgi:hypothetical protein
MRQRCADTHRDRHCHCLIVSEPERLALSPSTRAGYRLGCSAYRLSAPVAVRGVRMHDLRHTFARLQLSAGVRFMQASKWLGHSIFTLTPDVYGDCIPEEHGGVVYNLPEPPAPAKSADLPTNVIIGPPTAAVRPPPQLQLGTPNALGSASPDGYSYRNTERNSCAEQHFRDHQMPNRGSRHQIPDRGSRYMRRFHCSLRRASRWSCHLSHRSMNLSSILSIAFTMLGVR